MIQSYTVSQYSEKVGMSVFMVRKGIRAGTIKGPLKGRVYEVFDRDSCPLCSPGTTILGLCRQECRQFVCAIHQEAVCFHGIHRLRERYRND